MFDYEFLEHTGDIKIRVRGQQMADLFVGAATGMMAFLYGEDAASSEPEQRETIVLQAPDPEALLVDWLSELLTLSDMRGQVFGHFQVIELDNVHIISSVGCKTAEAEDDIKAVTWSELEISQSKDGWQAIVVFDI